MIFMRCWTPLGQIQNGIFATYDSNASHFWGFVFNRTLMVFPILFSRVCRPDPSTGRAFNTTNNTV